MRARGLGGVADRADLPAAEALQHERPQDVLHLFVLEAERRRGRALHVAAMLDVADVAFDEDDVLDGDGGSVCAAAFRRRTRRGPERRCLASTEASG